MCALFYVKKEVSDMESRIEDQLSNIVNDTDIPVKPKSRIEQLISDLEAKMNSELDKKVDDGEGIIPAYFTNDKEETYYSISWFRGYECEIVAGRSSSGFTQYFWYDGKSYEIPNGTEIMNAGGNKDAYVFDTEELKLKSINKYGVDETRYIVIATLNWSWTNGFPPPIFKGVSVTNFKNEASLPTFTEHILDNDPHPNKLDSSVGMELSSTGREGNVFFQVGAERPNLVVNGQFTNGLNAWYEGSDITVKTLEGLSYATSTTSIGWGAGLNQTITLSKSGLYKFSFRSKGRVSAGVYLDEYSAEMMESGEYGSPIMVNSQSYTDNEYVFQVPDLTNYNNRVTIRFWHEENEGTVDWAVTNIKFSSAEATPTNVYRHDGTQWVLMGSLTNES